MVTRQRTTGNSGGSEIRWLLSPKLTTITIPQRDKREREEWKEKKENKDPYHNCPKRSKRRVPRRAVVPIGHTIDNLPVESVDVQSPRSVHSIRIPPWNRCRQDERDGAIVLAVVGDIEADYCAFFTHPLVPAQSGGGDRDRIGGLTNRPLFISCGVITTIEDCGSVLSQEHGVRSALLDRDEVVWEEGSRALLQARGRCSEGAGQESGQEGEGETGLHFGGIIENDLICFAWRSGD